MNRVHISVVALLLGASGVLGVAAATRTAGLRAATPETKVSDAAIAARARRLNEVERAIGRARSDRPPALPAVPAARNARSTRPPRVLYRRPAPVVMVSTRHDDESEHEEEHEEDDD
jgi:hypothetical protein